MSTERTVPGRISGLLGRAQDALHYDFCPWANPWVYWMKHPLWSLSLALAASIICGVIVNPNVLIVSGVLLVSMSLGVTWPWVTMHGVSGAIEIERRRCCEQKPVTVRLRITNRWPWPVWGLYVDGGFFDDAQPVLALSRIGGWSTSEFDWTFVPTRRGVYPQSPPAIATKFPFGLTQASRPLGVSGRLIVWPETCALKSLPDAVELDFREDRLTDRQAGQQGDLLGTRLFRQGDSLRHVHWAQTARQGRLIVCERQAAARCALRVVIDLQAEHHQNVGTSASTLELVLRLAASICESLHRQHAAIECWLGDRQFTLDSGSHSLRMLLDALAAVPVAGVSHGLPLRPVREDVWTVAVTTERGCQTPVLHSVRRIVVVSAGSPPACVECGRNCWLSIAPTEHWREEFPHRWRRACHVA